MAEFTDEELAAEAATHEGDVETPAPEQQERPRDEHGRFASKEGEQQEAEPDDGRLPPNVYRAVKSERDAHKDTKEQLRVAQETLQALNAARARIAENANKVPEQQAPKEDDPTGINHLTQRLSATEQTLRERQQFEDAQLIDSQERKVLHQTLAQSEAAFIAQKPDYNDATQHLINARASQLRLLGVPDIHIGATLQEEATDLAKTAVAQGKDPAELIYQYAQMYGYAPAQQQQGGNAMLDAIAKGQKGRTLANVRGSGSGGTDLASLANAIAQMSDEEISANMRDPEFARAFAAVG